PETFVVDTLADTPDDGNYTAGNLSLREAIAIANRSVGVTETITFNPSLTSGGAQTITLSLGELLITNDVEIQGPGADNLTISANGASRVAHLSNAGRQIAVTISGLIMTKGSVTGSGGAILAGDESLILDAVWINSSTATVNGGGVAVDDFGALTVTNSALTG